MCDTDLDASVYSGYEDDLPFCDSCMYKLELLKVDVIRAEKILKEVIPYEKEVLLNGS